MKAKARLFELFDQASTIESESECNSFLERACAGDTALHAEICCLLAANKQVSTVFLAKPSVAPLLTGSSTPDGIPSLTWIGSWVGPYKLLEMIGEGGMGSVYLAEQETPVKRRVALKLLRSDLNNPLTISRFEAERQSVAMMDHPNIAHMYDFGTTSDGRPYFAMELVVGTPINDYCDAHCLSIRDRLRLFIPVCSAIQHAHQQGLIHRDIKPSNVLVAVVDGKPQPKVIDFGIAKPVDGRQGALADLTQAGVIFGTLEYMSPEQADNNVRRLDTRSDVYTLGVLLYEILTGSTPITRERLMDTALADLLRMIREDDPEKPSQRAANSPVLLDLARKRGSDIQNLRLQINGELDWIVMRALDKDRDRRYDSASALAADIRNYLEDKPVSACPPSHSYVISKWVQRNKILFSAACMVAFAVLAGVTGVIVQWRVAEDARAVAVNQEKLAQNNAKAARLSADAARRSEYAATLASALASRERHDFGQARRLLDGLPTELRGFEWRMLRQLCNGDEISTMRIGKTAGNAEGGECPEVLAWHPDGQSYAVFTADARLHTFDASGRELQPAKLIPIPEKARDSLWKSHTRLSYSPSGKYLAYCYGNVVRIIDSRSCEILFEDLLRMPHCGWLDDNRLLYGWNTGVSVGGDDNALVYNVGSKSKTQLPAGLSAPLCVSMDRKYAVLTKGNKVLFYNVEDLFTGSPRITYTPVEKVDMVNEIAVDAKGEHMVCAMGSFNQTEKFVVISTKDGSTVFSQYFHSPITCLALHPSQSLLAVGGDDAIVRLFRYTKPVPNNCNSYDDGVVQAIREPLDNNGAHDPARDLLTRTAQDGRVQFLLGHERRVNGIGFSPDGNNLMSMGADGTMRLWDQQPAQPQRCEMLDTLYYRSHPAASADGRRVLVQKFFGKTYLWRKKKPELHIPADSLPVAVLSNGTFATASPNTGELIMWAEEQDTVKELWRIPGLKFTRGFATISRCVLTADEKIIVGEIPGKLFLVDLESKKVTTSDDFGMQMGKHCVSNLAISPDGKWVAATAFGHRTTIHAINQIGTVALRLGDDRDFDTALAFHPRGHLLYTGNEDGTVRVWNTATWKELPALRWNAHKGAVTALAVSNDGTLIATSGGSSLKFWRAEHALGDLSHELLSMRVNYYSCNWIYFARNEQGHDRALLYSAPFGTMNVFEADGQTMPAK